MKYTLQAQKFISGQNFYTGLRLTAGVIIPAVALHYFGLLASTMAVPLGALCVGLTDSPGPVHHRRNSLFASIVINFIVALISGYLHAYKGFVITEIIVFGMFFSLIGVYGNRINSIGLIALLVFVFNIDGRISNQHIVFSALLFTAGGVWYTVMSLVLYSLRPYKQIQQLLGECLIETSAYMKIKAAFYNASPDYQSLYNDLMKSQISIHTHQDNLREILFKTRTIVNESTAKGRVLMLMFLDSVDLFERIITSQQEYKLLHTEFDETIILNNYRTVISSLADELYRIGIAIQSNAAAEFMIDVDELMKKAHNDFDDFKKQFLKPNTIEGFIRLRQVLNNLTDIAERINRLHKYTVDKRISSKLKRKIQPERFIEHRQIDPRLIVENLSLKSSHFRHAVRITLALLIGYIFSLLFPLGHGYWILLTIVTILKPGYGITRERNINRLAGTFIGAAFGFLMLSFITNNTVLFIIMLLAMISSYSLLKVNYLMSVCGITLYVLISIHFLNPAGLKIVLTDRILDTIIGSAIAYIISVSALPIWQHKQIGEYILNALKANRNYFITIAKAFTGKPLEATSYRLARKGAFVALANLSDNFQRMLSDPKSKQFHLKEYHQFVTTSHMLTSYIASLSYYAQTLGKQFVTNEFESFVQQIDAQFHQAINIYYHSFEKQNLQYIPTPHVKEEVQKLLMRRKKEMIGTQNNETEFVRKKLAYLKTISDQFELINTMISEENKILQKIEG